MSQSPVKTSAPPPNRWQFSISGMLVFTLSVAIGAAVAGSFLQGKHISASQSEMGIKEGLAGGLLADTNLLDVIWFTLSSP